MPAAEPVAAPPVVPGYTVQELLGRGGTGEVWRAVPRRGGATGGGQGPGRGRAAAAGAGGRAAGRAGPPAPGPARRGGAPAAPRRGDPGGAGARPAGGRQPRRAAGRSAGGCARARWSPCAPRSPLRWPTRTPTASSTATCRRATSSSPPRAARCSPTSASAASSGRPRPPRSPPPTSTRRWRAAGAPGPASDVFGVAAAAFHALTGIAPWNAATPADTLVVAAHGHLPDLAELAPDAPPALLEVIGARAVGRPARARVGRRLRPRPPARLPAGAGGPDAGCGLQPGPARGRSSPTSCRDAARARPRSSSQPPGRLDAVARRPGRPPRPRCRSASPAGARRRSWSWRSPAGSPSAGGAARTRGDHRAAATRAGRRLRPPRPARCGVGARGRPKPATAADVGGRRRPGCTRPGRRPSRRVGRSCSAVSGPTAARSGPPTRRTPGAWPRRGSGCAASRPPWRTSRWSSRTPDRVELRLSDGWAAYEVLDAEGTPVRTGARAPGHPGAGGPGAGPGGVAAGERPAPGLRRPGQLRPSAVRRVASRSVSVKT